MVNKLLPALAFAITVLAAQAANAVTVVGLTSTQTLSFRPTLAGAVTTGNQVLNFNQFNVGSLNGGPRYLLTGVTISYVPAVIAPLSTVQVTSTNGSKRMVEAVVSASNILSSSAFTSFGSTITGVSGIADFETGVLQGQANGLVRTVGITYTPTTSFAAPTISNLAPFIGAGAVSVTNTISNLVTSTRLANGTNGSANASVTNSEYQGSFQIIYTFNDFLPEPGTWATMILGFGAIGVAMRRRRSTALA